MDGGGRLLRSISEFGNKLARSSIAPAPTSSLAFAGAFNARAFSGLPQAAPSLPRRHRKPNRLLTGLVQNAIHSPFMGTCLVVAFLGSAAGFGAVRGGSYDAFVAAYGTLPDVTARLSGFAIKAVTITGAKELHEDELLKLAGIGPRSSLLFLNVAQIRERLKAVPLIRDASVSKLYPDRLLIEIEERQPYALWQKNGVVSIVAADGTPIDGMRDARFERLPLVVGDGANGKLTEYLSILDAAGDMRDRIKAGIYESGRRWTLKMDNGIEVDLPETNPAPAVARFALLEHDGHILEKDIISADLRLDDRVVARLSADAAAARAATLTSKTKKKGAAT